MAIAMAVSVMARLAAAVLGIAVPEVPVDASRMAQLAGVSNIVVPLGMAVGASVPDAGMVEAGPAPCGVGVAGLAIAGAPIIPVVGGSVPGVAVHAAAGIGVGAATSALPVRV